MVQRLIEQTRVLDALGLAVVVGDGDGVVSFANDAAASLYDAPVLAGRPLLDLLGGEDSEDSEDSADDVRGGVARALAGETWHGEVSRTRADGSGQLLGLTVSPVRDDGRIAGVVVAAEQLSAVRRAEAAAEASERRLRLAHDAAELGSWQWDMASGHVVWDERLEAIFGLPPGGYDGTFETWLAMLHEEDRGQVMTTVTEALEHRSSYTLKSRVVWPDGTVHWIESLGRVTVDDQGEPTGTIGCVWDTTAKVRVEQELTVAFEAQRQASELAEAMSAERERLMARLSDIAEHLQTSLAASPIPEVDGVSIAVHYAPGGDELEHVGGDWYDAVRTADGALAFVVGDVMGRGVRAATTMIRVRAGIRGLLTVDPTPGVVLEHADAMLDRDAPEQFVTAVAVLIDPGTRRLSLCNAGHVPVVVARPDGSTVALGDGTGLPLGIPEGLTREGIDRLLDPGTTVVLVTDGVVEGRHYDIDEGLDRLRSVVGELVDAPVEEVVDRVASLADRSLRDDVTVVAIRFR